MNAHIATAHQQISGLPMTVSVAGGRLVSDRNHARFLLGLPYLADNELVATAKALNAPVLMSANAFSKWRKDALGITVWEGFNTQALRHGADLDMCLGSAGFVAAVKYRRFPWTVDDYLDLCAAHPWRWFASSDWCVEPEAARDEETILNRISGTVRLNTACHRGALDRGIADRLMPVIQGWAPSHYRRCLDRMSTLVAGRSLIGIGSMCRRQLGGPAGVSRILDDLDRALGSDRVQFHLFGLKSTAWSIVADHPRVASVDSQAYGIQARREAIKIRKVVGRFSKTNDFTAGIMATWYREQLERIASRAAAWVAPQADLPLPETKHPRSPIESRYQACLEDMRMLHEDGELDFGDLNPIACYEAAFCCDDD